MDVQLFRSKGTSINALWIIFRRCERPSTYTSLDFNRPVQLEVYTTAEQWPGLPVMSEMSGDTASDSSFNRALQWLNECTSTHRQCSSSSKDQKTPRRLIDITYDRPKPIEDHGFIERYVCLSHCWGESQPLRTTTATIQKHKHEIAWDAIPRTFQDAIQVTKRLHINYIWIDSLCIIQDDAEDWAAQAA
jgi:hypothetical protein